MNQITNSKKILYLFRRPVTKDLQLLKQKQVPEDIFYGLIHLKKYFHVNTFDIAFKYKPFIALQYVINLFVTRFVDIGFSLIPALFHLHKLNKYDLVFATADTLGLPLALFKKLSLYKTPLGFNTVGLYDGLIKKRSRIARAFYAWFLTSIDFFVSGGSYQECQKLIKYLNLQPKKLTFIPFGIDTSFFTPDDKPEKNYILAIGADPSRDWPLYKQIARELAHEKFTIVTHKNLIKIPLPANVKLEYSLSYVKIREKIQAAKLIIILSQHNYHFAGQSTAMRAMSSGKAVIFTRTPGVEEYNFKNYRHCIMVKPGNANDVMSAIKHLNHSAARRQKMGKAAREIIKKHYSIENYSQKLIQVFVKYLK